MGINEQMTNNRFVDYWMKKIPEDPYTQSLYMYSLTWIVFLGLLGYGIVAWYSFLFFGFSLKNFFSALFMTAISLISLFGLKQTRNQFLILKQMKFNSKPIQSFEEMIKEASIK